MNEGRNLREAVDAASTNALDEALNLVFGSKADDRDSPRDESSEFVGRYKLLEQIGEGGFGVVYEAEQREPIDRRVALKIIKLGMDTKQVVARFEVERQALAIMDHPNIARVLDGGATESGRPFFVMELVKGMPITEYCDRNSLTPRDRLELFVTVCQAVQHAHQKGIIHRDIKPSNVLVALRDGRPMPKVIDFGVAKATNQQLTEKTLVTRQGQMIGTPQYMSPEQAAMSGLDIDTRTDIYSLGVLLYELLTGGTPIDHQRLRDATIDEMQRIICDEEPVKPSARISQSTDALTSIAAHRQVDASKLSKLLRRDLDWIVMKALDKDRARRYQTANGFAMDVQRYLDDEPVVAGPPSAGYQLRKFARKHKRLLSTTAGFAAILLLGTVVSISLAIRATHEASRANQAQVTANAERNAATDARKKAVFERNRAEASLYFARIALANRAWQTNDVARTIEMLDKCRPQGDELDRRGFEWHYLNRLCHSEQFRFTDHSGAAFCVAYSRDGRFLASSGGGNLYYKNPGETAPPGEVIVRDATTGHVIHTLRGHRNIVTGVTFSPDGRTLASASHDRTVRLWDLKTGRERAALAKSAWSVAFSPDGKSLATTFAVVTIWDVETGEEVSRIEQKGPNTFPNVAFHPDGKKLAIPYEATIRLYDLKSGRVVRKFDGSYPVAFSGDGNSLACSGVDGVLRVYSTVTGEQKREIRKHEDPRALAFSPDGRMLASAGNDGVIRLWDLDTGEQRNALRGHREIVRSIAFRRGSAQLASASFDGSVSVWNLTRSSQPRRIDAWGWNLAFDNENAIAVAQRDGIARMHATTGKLLSRHAIDGTEVSRWPRFDFAFNVDATQIAAPSQSEPKVVAIWDVASGREIRRLRGHRGPVNTVVFRPDGRQIGTAAHYRVKGKLVLEIKIWDLSSGKELTNRIANVSSEKGIIFSLAFSHDGRKLAGADNGNRLVRVWDTRTGEQMLALGGFKRCHGIAFHPDGSQLAATDPYAKTVRVWNAETGKPLFQLAAPIGVTSVAFSPDGRRLVAAGYGPDVPIWDTQTGTTVLVLQRLGQRAGTGGQNPRVVFSRDGMRIATQNYDSSLTLWDARLP